MTIFQVLRLLTDMSAGAAGISVRVPRAEVQRERRCVQPCPSAADESADFVFRGPCETELGRVFPEPV